MLLTPLDTLTWAYQLHYYLAFRTYRRIPLFASSVIAGRLVESVNEICERHDYHLLQCKTYPDNVRCLLSLKATQSISKVVQTIKANSSRLIGAASQVWGHGFLARSVGRVQISAVRTYLEQQAQHHGYANRLLPPVFRYRNANPITLFSAHSVFELNHHLVFSTRFRAGVFTSCAAEALADYWQKVAAKWTFAVDQISVVPDHVHLLIRTVPKMNIEQCALALLNNGQYFIGKNYPQLMISAGVDQLWQPSAYAGTCGDLNTALIKHWLSE